MVNDNRLSEQRRMLGFVNPLLYSQKFRDNVVHDIIQGFNPGCGTEGFEAKIGWDPVRPAALVSFRVIFNVG